MAAVVTCMTDHTDQTVIAEITVGSFWVLHCSRGRCYAKHQLLRSRQQFCIISNELAAKHALR